MKKFATVILLALSLAACSDEQPQKSTQKKDAAQKAAVENAFGGMSRDYIKK